MSKIKNKNLEDQITNILLELNRWQKMSLEINSIDLNRLFFNNGLVSSNRQLVAFFISKVLKLPSGKKRLTKTPVKIMFTDFVSKNTISFASKTICNDWRTYMRNVKKTGRSYKAKKDTVKIVKKSTFWGRIKSIFC